MTHVDTSSKSDFRTANQNSLFCNFEGHNKFEGILPREIDLLFRVSCNQCDKDELPLLIDKRNNAFYVISFISSKA